MRERTGRCPNGTSSPASESYCDNDSRAGLSRQRPHASKGTAGVVAPAGPLIAPLPATEDPTARRDHRDRREKQRVKLELELLHSATSLGRFGQVWVGLTLAV
jgi:hypothetical protein